MKIRTRTRSRSLSIDMVPMVNFAFLLLIFVILVGSMSAPDVLGVRPPASDTRAAAAADEGLAIDARGRIAFAGELLAPDAVVERAQRWKAENGERVLVVKADARADAEYVVKILETLRGAGIARVSLLTSRRS